MDNPEAYYEVDRIYPDLPDPSSHRSGWVARKVDGIWCVGQDGNLDTKYDATVQITGGFLSEKQAKEAAEWIAKTYNEARSTQK